ncbi:LINE-1 retrotransposable element ORF1 protein [Plecturocebus cupreus]
MNKPDVHSETQSESRQLQRRQVDKSTKMGRNQCKKAENTRNQNASPPTGDHSSSSAREQGLMEDECEELTESGFRRWTISNFCELKEHVLTQCKETKNLERRFNEMLTRMDKLEKNISELMELKNTTRELHEACTSFNSRIDQAEERISEVEDQLNEIKQEGKMTEKRVKRNEQNLQEIWDYVKRPNLRLIGVPECEEENVSKLENTLQDIIQENFPNLARQANIQVQEIQRTPQRYSSRRATPRHIIVRFTRVEMKEKMLRAAREKVRVTHKGKPIRLTADLSAETLQARREWGPTFKILKEKNFQPRISYPAKLSFISEGKIKFFANKQVLRDYITTRPALQELLKEALHMDGNNQYQPFQKHTKRFTILDTREQSEDPTKGKRMRKRRERGEEHIEQPPLELSITASHHHEKRSPEPSQFPLVYLNICIPNCSSGISNAAHSKLNFHAFPDIVKEFYLPFLLYKANIQEWEKEEGSHISLEPVPRITQICSEDKPGDSQAEQPHGSPVRLFRLGGCFAGAAVLCTKSTGLCALLTGEWSYGKAD